MIRVSLLLIPLTATLAAAAPGVARAVHIYGALLRDGTWTDTTYDADRMAPHKVGFMSDDYFALLNARPAWGAYLAVGERVLVVLEGKAYQIVAADEGDPVQLPPPATPAPTATRAVARTDPEAPTVQPEQPAAPGEARKPASGLCGGALSTSLLALLGALWFARRH